MFSDLLLILDNSGLEVGVTSRNVTFRIQVESVEVGEAGKRKHTANVSQVWKATENRIEAPPVVPLRRRFRLI